MPRLIANDGFGADYRLVSRKVERKSVRACVGKMEAAMPVDWTGFLKGLQNCPVARER